MKPESFFSPEFLDEAEREITRLNHQLNCVQPFGHPAELSQNELGLICRFYNRLLFLLRAGGRISEQTYRDSLEVCSFHYINDSE